MPEAGGACEGAGPDGARQIARDEVASRDRPGARAVAAIPTEGSAEQISTGWPREGPRCASEAATTGAPDALANETQANAPAGASPTKSAAHAAAIVWRILPRA